MRLAKIIEKIEARIAELDDEIRLLRRDMAVAQQVGWGGAEEISDEDAAKIGLPAKNRKDFPWRN